VVPVFVQLDNGYDDIVAPAPIKNPNQVLLPLTANRITGRSSREQIAKIQAAMTFGQPYPLQTAGPSGPVPDHLVDPQTPGSAPSRYARIRTVAHPGPIAPLGWTLSKTAQNELEDQLGVTENKDQIKALQRWIGGEVQCAPGAP